MKYLKSGLILIALFLFSCTENHSVKKSVVAASATTTSKRLAILSQKNDKEEIQKLMREMLNWSSTKNNGDIIPIMTDSKDSICIGFDLEKHKANLEKLKATNFFSAEFIENYNQIILTLDKEMRDKKFSAWSTGELPPFNFANDVNPWCDCQDNFSWDAVKVYVINLNNEKGELYWKWGDPGKDASADWKEFSYKFKVKKEDGKWKVSYLEGFDFNDSIKS